MPDPFARHRTLGSGEKERVVKALKGRLSVHEEVSFAYLHGSFAENRPFHDLDVAVYLDPAVVDPTLARQYESDLGVELESRVKIQVDVRALNDSPVAFRYHVLKGQPLLVRDEDLLDEFRARTWDDYLDFVPFARQYLREVLGE